MSLKVESIFSAAKSAMQQGRGVDLGTAGALAVHVDAIDSKQLPEDELFGDPCRQRIRSYIAPRLKVPVTAKMCAIAEQLAERRATRMESKGF